MDLIIKHGRKPMLLLLLLLLIPVLVACGSNNINYINDELQAESSSEHVLPPLETAGPEAADADVSVAPAEELPRQPLPGAGRCIVIDPGHQSHGNPAQEPIGPGASETKAKVSDGTCGTVTKLDEYELNLQVSLKLRSKLEQQGYTVVMTRETNGVDISNSQRAQLANENSADAFIRIHANGSQRPEESGLLTICMTEENPYNAALYQQSLRLSDCIGRAVAEQTGASNRGITQTDAMTGINWSSVPVTILEMGFMTNPEEDRLLASDEYQEKIADGIANGLAAYFDAGDETEDALQDLRELIQTELDTLSSSWDVWVETLQPGGTFHCTANHSEAEPMVSASLIKLFIMGAVYERLDKQALEEEQVSGSLEQMIVYSDNESANRLVRLLGDGDAAAGIGYVNAWSASIGCEDVQMNRLLLEQNGLENYVSARSCATLLRLIYKESCVSADASQKMLELLKAQQINDRIPQGLPGGTVCAHKTGNLPALCIADVGIVFSPAIDYIICIICNDPYTDAGATQECRELSAFVYDYFN